MLETLTHSSRLIGPRYTFYGVIPKLASGSSAIYDGDTVTLLVDLGMSNWQGPLNYRLLGIQAPEIRPLATRKAGTAARDHLMQLVEAHAIQKNDESLPSWPIAGHVIVVKTHKKARAAADYRAREARGKFGRYLVELIGQGEHGEPVNLNHMMLMSGHAVEYPQ